MKRLLAVALGAAFALSGCTSLDKLKVRSIELDGMYASDTGQVAIGSVDWTTSPENCETAILKLKEDTAWLSPGTKTYDVRVFLTGTNSVSHVEKVVESICRVFSGIQPSVGGSRAALSTDNQNL